MSPMGKFMGLRGIFLRLALLGLLAEIGCSRQIGVASEEADQTSQIPFHEEASSDSPASQSGSAPSQYLDSESSLPFHDVQRLPAGTLLVVRLKSPISAEHPGSTNSFEGILDTPIVVKGTTLIPRGAEVTGRVESARISQLKAGRGYVQLALQSLRVNETDVPVQTASLFVRQSAQKNPSGPMVDL
jgi:hypothetical protein